MNQGTPAMYMPLCDQKMIKICEDFGLKSEIMSKSDRVGLRNNYKLGDVVRSYKLSGELNRSLPSLADKLKALGFKLFSLNEKPMYVYTAIDGRVFSNRAKAGMKTDAKYLDSKKPAALVPFKKPDPAQAAGASGPYKLDEDTVNWIADKVVEKLLNIPIKKFLNL